MEEKKMEVVINNNYADSTPYVTFTFCILCLVFWANCVGYLGEGATLAIGMCQLGCYGVYHMGTSRLTDTGNLFGTNIYGVFACVFAGIGGLANVTAGICSVVNVPFDGRVASLSYVLSGVLLLVFVPAMLRMAKTDFLIFLFGGIGVTGCGLVGLGILPELLPLYGWALLICGAAGFINVLKSLFSCYGVTISTGTPFLKDKKSAENTNVLDG